MENAKDEQNVKMNKMPKMDKIQKMNKIQQEDVIINQNEISNIDLAIEELKRQKSGKKIKLKKIGIVLLFTMLLTSIFLIYGKIAVYYQTHFFPNTYINGFDCSNLDMSTVAIFLESQAQEYSIEVLGRNEKGEKISLGILQSRDFGLKLLDTEEVVNGLLEKQEEWLWITTLSGKEQRSHSLVQGTVFDKEMLKAALEGLKAVQKENMILPKDAHISEYSQEKNLYTIVPETMGTTLDMEKVITSVEDGIVKKSQSIDLEELECYLTAEITSRNKKLQNTVKTVNRWLQTDIIYDWNGSEVRVNSELLKDWISLTKETFPKPELDEEAVADFVTEQAKEYDTYGRTRTFLTSRGIELQLPSGAYGWRTDQESETEELLKLIYQGSKQEREPIYLKKAAQKGRNDIGSSYVEADLTYQHLYLYKDGVLVLETDFVSGDMNVAGNITPQGVFGITYKTTNAVLRGADYETPVTYWMPFHGNFGMHDATWRTEFGGTIYLTNGSHGCINLPLDKAALIYQYVSTGFPVICYYY